MRQAIKGRGAAYPNAPVPVVMRRTRTSLSSAKRLMIPSRFDDRISPSTRTNTIFSARRCLATRSSVRVQQEKMMLLRYQYRVAGWTFQSYLLLPAKPSLTSNMSAFIFVEKPIGLK
jgi:hypothetical protein